MKLNDLLYYFSAERPRTLLQCMQKHCVDEVSIRIDLNRENNLDVDLFFEGSDEPMNLREFLAESVLRKDFKYCLTALR